MEDKKITEQESLEIIQKMIEKTRQSMFNGKPLLCLGYILALGLIVFNLLAFYVNESWAENLVIFYLVTFVVAIISITIFMENRRKKSHVSSYSDRIVYGAWSIGLIFMGLVCYFFLQAIYAYGIVAVGYMQFVLAGFLYMTNLFSGIAQSTGKMLLVTKATYGVTFGLFGGIATTLFGDNVSSMKVLIEGSFIFLFVVVVALIIPGHRLCVWNRQQTDAKKVA